MVVISLNMNELRNIASVMGSYAVGTESVLDATLIMGILEKLKKQVSKHIDKRLIEADIQNIIRKHKLKRSIK